MPEGADANIDSAQKQLEALKGQEKEKSVADLMRQYENTFFKEVDNFQGLDKTLKITSGEANKYYEKGKTEVNGLLLRVAARGQYLVDQATPKEQVPASPEKPGEKKLPKKPAENKDNIDTLASSLKSSLSLYKEKLTVISEIVGKRSEAFKLLQDVWELQGSPEVVNSAPNIPDSLIKAIDAALYGKNSAGMCEVMKMVQNNPNLPPEFIKECQNNFNQKNMQSLMEIKITGLQQKAVYEQKFEGEMVSKFMSIQHGKKPGEKPTFVFTADGEKLPAEKKQQLLLMLGGIRLAEEENIEAATCPKVTERFWAGKALFESGKFDEAKTALDEFLGTDLTSMGYDKKLATQKDKYEGRAKEMISQIEKIGGDNKDFFDAQKFLNSGDIIAAKKLLLKYVAEHKKEEGKPDFTGSAKEMLKRIALAQVTDAKEKFKIHKEPEKERTYQKKIAGGEYDTVVVPNPEYQRFEKYRDALNTIEKSITDGKYLDFTEAYNALAAKIPGGFDAKDDFNMMSDQVTMDKGPQGLLELARKYREKGKLFGDAKYLALAEEYFIQYFGPKLQETAKKYVTIEQLRSKYYSNPTFHAEISNKEGEAKKKYDEKAAKDSEWAKQNPWDAKKVRTAIENQAFSEMQTEETLKMQNSHFNLNPANIGDATQQGVWGEFMNMKGMHGQGKSWEPFALSDEAVGQLVKELPIDIAMIAAAAALASVTAGAASGLVLEAGLSVAERQALAFGVRSGLRQFGAYGAGLLVETTAFTAGHSVLQGIRTGHFSITDMAEFRTEWWGNFTTMGVLGVAGRASAALKFGKVSSFGVEMAAMGATSGHLGINDLAMVLGLKLGHAVPEAFKPKAKEVPKPKEAPKPTEKAKPAEKQPALESQASDLPTKKKETKQPSKETEEAIAANLREKLTMTDEKLTVAEENAVIEGMKLGSPGVMKVSEYIEEGRMSPRKEVLDKILAQDPLTAVNIMEKYKIPVTSEIQVKLTEVLLLDAKNYGTFEHFVENGIIKPGDHGVIETMCKTEDGLGMLINWGMMGKIKFTKYIIEKITLTENGRMFLEDTFGKDNQNDHLLGESMSSDVVREKIKERKQALLDAEDFHWEAQVRGKEVLKSIPEVTAKIDSGTYKPGESLIGDIMHNLKARDPQGYEILKLNSESLNSVYIEAIIEGRKIEFTDSKGQKITAYEGIHIGEGGMGKISACAFVTEGGAKLQFAVIKKPHLGNRQQFIEEGHGAEIVQGWGHPNINKALHIGSDFIIYESGPNARDLTHEFRDSTPKKALQIMRQFLEGIRVYQKKGYLHGDLKELNAIVFDTPLGPKVQIIDNNPIEGSFAEQPVGIRWVHTPEFVTPQGFKLEGYITPEITSSVQFGKKGKFQAIDNYAIGKMLNGHPELFGYEPLSTLAEQAQKPEISGNPGFIDKMIREVDKLLKAPDKIPGQVFETLPVDAFSPPAPPV